MGSRRPGSGYDGFVMLARSATLLVCLAACAAPPQSKTASSESCAACDELDRDRSAAVATDPPPASESPFVGYERAPSRSVFEGAPNDRWAVRQIGAPATEQRAARPKRTKAVDIDLVRAPFDETARLLSDAGRFNVVVEAPSASAVTVHLKAIEPYDALLILAEARGLEVSYRRGVVVVTSR